VQVTAPFVHVGYPKTASTWLQNQLFSRPAIGFHAVPPLEILEHLVFRDGMTFDPDVARDSFAPYLCAARSEGQVPVLSNEVLVGDQTQGGRYWGAMVADRLHQVFPDANILMIVREQASMLVSSYKQYIRVGGRSTLTDFVQREPGFDAVCRLDFFEYDQIIGFYQGLFDPSQVLVLPYELLRQDGRDFVQRVLRLAGIDSDVQADAKVAYHGWGGATIDIRRRLNRILSGWTYCDGPVPPKSWRVGDRACRRMERFIPSTIQQRRERSLEAIAAETVRGRFAASNRRTADLIGFDLAAFGYEW